MVFKTSQARSLRFIYVFICFIYLCRIFSNLQGQNYIYRPRYIQPFITVLSAARRFNLPTQSTSEDSFTSPWTERTTKEAPESWTDTCSCPHGDKITVFCSKVWWSDETKFVLFLHKNKKFVWKSWGETFRRQNTEPPVGHGGGRIMLRYWNYQSMKEEDHLQILHVHLRLGLKRFPE